MSLGGFAIKIARNEKQCVHFLVWSKPKNNFIHICMFVWINFVAHSNLCHGFPASPYLSLLRDPPLDYSSWFVQFSAGEWNRTLVGAETRWFYGSHASSFNFILDLFVSMFVWIRICALVWFLSERVVIRSYDCINTSMWVFWIRIWEWVMISPLVM